MVKLLYFTFPAHWVDFIKLVTGKESRILVLVKLENDVLLNNSSFSQSFSAVFPCFSLTGKETYRH